MLPIKNNYRTKYKDLICRGCKAENETQQHVLQTCKEIHKNNKTKNNLIDKTLKKNSTHAWKPKIEQLMENINYQIPSNEETKNITKKKLKTSYQCNLPYQYHKSK